MKIEYNYITVHIPTYNRESQLKKTLQMLSEQTNEQFYVQIFDNASSYNADHVLDGFSKNFADRCFIKKRKINVGAPLNYLDGFIECRTRWIWPVADDDILKEDCIEKAYFYIKKYAKASCFNFSLADDMPYDEDGVIKCSSIDDFICLYEDSWKRKNSIWHGDLIFASNKLYNAEDAGRHVGYAISYSYCPFPVIFLILKLLEEHKEYYCVNDKTIEYVPDDVSERSWNLYDVMLSTKILPDLKLNISVKKKKELLGCIAFGIRMIYRLYFYERQENVNQKYFLETMYNSIYRHILPFHRRMALRIISSVCKTNTGYHLVRIFMQMRFSVKFMKWKIRIKSVIGRYTECKKIVN